jgi:hypothetical protein
MSFDDVPCSKPNLSGSIHPECGRPLGDFASKFWREVGDYLIEGRVAMAAVEKFEEMCAEG